MKLNLDLNYYISVHAEEVLFQYNRLNCALQCCNSLIDEALEVVLITKYQKQATLQVFFIIN